MTKIDPYLMYIVGIVILGYYVYLSYNVGQADAATILYGYPRFLYWW